MNKNLELFKLKGSYIGLIVGFIASLQTRIVRLFLIYSGLDELKCGLRNIEVNCYIYATLLIIIFVIVGFLIGGIIEMRLKAITK